MTTNWDTYGFEIAKIAGEKGVGLNYLRSGVLYPPKSENPSFIEFHFSTVGTTRVGEVRAICDDIAQGLGLKDVRVENQKGRVAIQINLRKMQSYNLDEAIAIWRSKTEVKSFEFLLGISYSSKPLSGNISQPECAHILLAGQTGCGKTTLAQGILTSLASSTKPSKLQVIVLDATKSNARFANTIGKHVHTHATNIKEAKFALGKLMASLKTRKGPDADPQEPRIIVYCDELPELCRQGGKEIIDAFDTIGNLGRGLGVHMIVCAQYPKNGEVSSVVRANATLRITGKVGSAQISSACTGIPNINCQRLAGKGDFIAIFGSDDRRFQAPMLVLPDELGTPTYDITQGWKHQDRKQDTPRETQATPQDAITHSSLASPDREERIASLAARITIVLLQSGKNISKDEVSRRVSSDGRRVEGAAYVQRFNAAYMIALKSIEDLS